MISDDILGSYALFCNPKKFSVMQFTEDVLKQDGERIATWSVIDNKIVIVMDNPNFGQAILHQENDLLVGKNPHSNGTTFNWILYKVKSSPLKHPNLSIIIHGPLCHTTLQSIYHYQNFAELIVVAPASSTKSLNDVISLFVKPILYDVSAEGKLNDASRYFHFFSVAKGLAESTKEWAIKMRSDEFYSNLDPFLEKMIATPVKIITNDVFFRRFRAWPYHPSDHLVGGKRDYLKRGYDLAQLWCEQPHEATKTFPKTNVRNLVPEQHMCLAMMANFTKTLTQDEFAKHFDIIRSHQLGPFKIRCNNWGKEFIDDSYIVRQFDITNSSEIKMR